MTDLFDNHIPLMRPWITDDEINSVVEVLKSGWITQGEKVDEFEKAVADYIGVKEAVATNSCTSSMHLSFIINGISTGDSVICPSHTCMASANAILHCGATPRFCDIDPLTYNMSPESIEANIDDKTKAILVVHQIGLPAHLEEIEKIAKKYNLIIIEDAACSFGGVYKGSKLGSFGHPACFSFHPRKIITTAEGGMVVTNDSDFAEIARQIRSTGASISDLTRHRAKGTLVQKYERIGYNYRMTDIHAAIGLAQLRKISMILSERSGQAEYYNNQLADIKEISTPYVPDYARHAWSSYLIKITALNLSRDDVLRFMSDNGVSCRIGIQPLHLEPFFRGTTHCVLPETENAAKNTMFLPIYPGMPQSDQDRIIMLLKKILVNK